MYIETSIRDVITTRKFELSKQILYIITQLMQLGFRLKEGCEIICRPPTIVGDQLRRGGKCAGLNLLFMPAK